MSIQLNNLTINGGVAGSAFGDPYWSYVTALLHFDGANGSTTITDSSSYGAIPDRTGATISNSNYKFGTGSGQFSSGAAVGFSGSQFLIGTQDFTVESWIYPTSLSSVFTIASSVNSSTTSPQLF